MCMCRVMSCDPRFAVVDPDELDDDGGVCARVCVVSCGVVRDPSLQWIPMRLTITTT